MAQVLGCSPLPSPICRHTNSDTSNQSVQPSVPSFRHSISLQWFCNQFCLTFIPLHIHFRNTMLPLKKSIHEWVNINYINTFIGLYIFVYQLKEIFTSNHWCWGFLRQTEFNFIYSQSMHSLFHSGFLRYCRVTCRTEFHCSKSFFSFTFFFSLFLSIPILMFSNQISLIASSYSLYKDTQMLTLMFLE